jgi:hypothetical protein
VRKGKPTCVKPPLLTNPLVPTTIHDTHTKDSHGEVSQRSSHNQEKVLERLEHDVYTRRQLSAFPLGGGAVTTHPTQRDTTRRRSYEGRSETYMRPGQGVACRSLGHTGRGSVPGSTDDPRDTPHTWSSPSGVGHREIRTQSGGGSGLPRANNGSTGAISRRPVPQQHNGIHLCLCPCTQRHACEGFHFSWQLRQPPPTHWPSTAGIVSESLTSYVPEGQANA